MTTPESDSPAGLKGAELPERGPLARSTCGPATPAPASDMPTGAPAWVRGALLALWVFATFAFALRGGFLWDDDLHVTANPTIIGPLGLKEIWTSARANYFPLVLSNFWLQHAAWGLNPVGYHAVTLACHAIAALLLWRVLVALKVPGAWFGAALWAVHPVQAESVAWISELKNTQSAVFFLAAVLLFVRWLKRSEVGRGLRSAPRPGPESRPDHAAGDATPSSRCFDSKRDEGVASPGKAPVRAAAVYLLALFAAILALLSKSSTVMLPVALALVAWWIRGRLERRTGVALVPFFALSALAGAWTIWEQKFHSGAIGAEWTHSWPERAAIAGGVVWFYLGKLAWPASLSFIYPRWQVSAATPSVYVPLLLAVTGIVSLWASRRNLIAGAGFFAAAFFVALLFPVLGFFDVYFFRYSYVGDHFQYLASMGPLALLGAGIAQLGAPLADSVVARCFSPRAGEYASRAKAPRYVLPIALLVLLSGLTAWQCRDYRDSETLWRATVARNPSATMAWVNLGDVLRQQGRYDEALANFNRALALKPDMADVHNDMGNVLVLERRSAEAATHFERALALQPKNADVHNNYGNVLRELGRVPEAMQHYRDAIALAPDFPDPHASLGEALLRQGGAAEAERELRRAIALQPASAAPYGYLGRALMMLGRHDEALAAFEQAVARAPGSAEAHGNMGTALAQRGRLAEAVVEFEAAIRAAPQLPATHLNLGMALAGMGQWPEAAAQFRRVVELQPGSAEAEARLAIALVNAHDLAAAVPHFEAALRLDPNAADVHRNFAQLLRALGHTHEALEQFEAAERSK